MGNTILYIEDNPDNMLLVQRALEIAWIQAAQGCKWRRRCFYGGREYDRSDFVGYKPS